MIRKTYSHFWGNLDMNAFILYYPHFPLPISLGILYNIIMCISLPLFSLPIFPVHFPPFVTTCFSVFIESISKKVGKNL